VRGYALRTVFLKLGGSLITDKRKEEMPRSDVIERLAHEIAEALRMDPDLRLVLGHGSGSFGHVHGSRYGTRHGVNTPDQWLGFAATGDAAARLNRLVVSALLATGIPAWSIQPGAILRCRNGAVAGGSAETIALALARGLTPVVFGDVVLDEEIGGTIVSTEELFEWLLPYFRPRRLVLAGEVEGIYTADPQLDRGATLLRELGPDSLAGIEQGLGRSHGVDVTGGMSAKAAQAIRMVQATPGLEVIVCGGLRPGNVLAALSGNRDLPGTRIKG
jgi:isopentenyl phosphate kinase